MTGRRAAALVAAALAVVLVVWSFSGGHAQDRARSTSPVTSAVDSGPAAVTPPGAPTPSSAEVPAVAPETPPAAGTVDLSFHLETGSGAMLVELSIRPEESKVHLKAGGVTLLSSSGPGRRREVWNGDFLFRGHAFQGDLACDRSMRLESLCLKSGREVDPAAELLVDLFAEDGRTLAAERPPAVLDPKGAAYVLERRRQVIGGVAHDLVATLKPAE